MKTNTKIITDERALSIIQKPLMTEKSTTLNQFNQYSPSSPGPPKSPSQIICQDLSNYYGVVAGKPFPSCMPMSEQNLWLN